MRFGAVLTNEPILGITLKDLRDTASSQCQESLTTDSNIVRGKEEFL